jgi:hypothetical protein
MTWIKKILPILLACLLFTTTVHAQRYIITIHADGSVDVKPERSLEAMQAEEDAINAFTSQKIDIKYPEDMTEDELKQRNMVGLFRNKTGLSAPIVFYDDFDKDGIAEAFMLSGKVKNGLLSGDIYFVNGYSVTRLDSMEYVSTHLDTYDVGTGKILIAHSKGQSFIYGIKDGQPVCYQSGFGTVESDGKGEFTTQYATIDAHYINDGHDDSYYGHTLKQYYLYWDKKEQALREYGANEISLDEFLALPGAQDILNQDERIRDGYSVHDILYRANHIIHVNLRKPTQAGYDCANITVGFDADNMWVLDGDNSGGTRQGYYAKALYSELAVYPNMTGNPVKQANPTTSRVLVDGKQIPCGGFNIDGNNYFKLRDIAYSLNGTAKQFEVSFERQSINLTPGSRYTPVGGELAAGISNASSALYCESFLYLTTSDEYFKTTPYNINGNNFFKLRDLADILDFSVAWDENTNTVTIETKK